MTTRNRAPVTVLLISGGIMVGAGLGAAFGNVAIGIPAGMAVGAFLALLLNGLPRQG